MTQFSDFERQDTCDDADYDYHFCQAVLLTSVWLSFCLQHA
jgi:hypothetical protein